MDEWKEYKLGEILCEKGYIRGPFGSALKRGDMLNEGIPVYEQQHAIYGKRDFRYYISKDKYDEMKRFTVYPGDIIISCSGTIGEVSIIKEEDPKGIISQALLLLRSKKEVVMPEFLLYFFRTPQGHNSITSRSSGSVQVNIARRDVIEQIPLYLPHRKMQNRIVSILKSLDDKIEVNKQINDNLEQQAQALFKSWFVDFEPFRDHPFVESELGMIPKGWRVESLGNVCKCLLGGTPSRNKEDYWNGDIAWINSGEVNEFRITKPSEYITEEGLKNSATKLLPRKTTVLAITGATLGQVSLLEIDTCANQSVIGVLENDILPYEYIYPLINDRISELCSHMTGGAQQHINKNNVKGLSIIVPPSDVIERYKEKTSPIYNLIGNNCIETQKITSLRDSLLPKLMSGELKVNEIENAI